MASATLPCKVISGAQCRTLRPGIWSYIISRLHCCSPPSLLLARWCGAPPPTARYDPRQTLVSGRFPTTRSAFRGDVMERGAITGYMDVAQMTLYAFWLFFAGLVYYLRKEDKREGYPLITETGEKQVGFPVPPKPKRFLLPHGGEAFAPRAEDPQAPFTARPAGVGFGAPLVPATANPMASGVGPSAYALRA